MKEKYITKSHDRNYGIDLLRLFAMLMVVFLHILGHGGVLKAVENIGGTCYRVAWLMEIICLCAVDCFAIITGYVSSGKKYRVSRYIQTWVQVSFISFAISFFAFFKMKEIGIGTVAFSILPVLSQKYWYFTAYTGLYLLMPILNNYIDTVDEKQLRKTIIIIFVSVSVYGSVSSYMYGGDLFCINGGYSTAWLVILYLIGALLKRYPMSAFKTRYLCASLIFCVLATWILKLYGNEVLGAMVISYTSPMIVLQAVLWLLLFKRLTFPKYIRSIISFISPSAFSIYLIHEHPIVRKSLIINCATWVVSENAFIEIMGVFCISVSIFVLCLMLDIIVRRTLFVVFRIDLIVGNIVGKIETGGSLDQLENPVKKIKDTLIRIIGKLG